MELCQSPAKHISSDHFSQGGVFPHTKLATIKIVERFSDDVTAFQETEIMNFFQKKQFIMLVIFSLYPVIIKLVVVGLFIYSFFFFKRTQLQFLQRSHNGLSLTSAHCHGSNYAGHSGRQFATESKRKQLGSKGKTVRTWSTLTRGGWRSHRCTWKGAVNTDSKMKYHPSEMVVFEVNKIIIRVHGQRVLNEQLSIAAYISHSNTPSESFHFFQKALEKKSKIPCF